MVDIRINCDKKKEKRKAFKNWEQSKQGKSTWADRWCESVNKVQSQLLNPLQNIFCRSISSLEIESTH